jgi:hypothetical protein
VANDHQGENLSRQEGPEHAVRRNHSGRRCVERPWTALNYHRVAAKGPIWWREDICAENNVHVMIANEDFYLSADGLLMPARKDQAPPDLRYFKQTTK